MDNGGPNLIQDKLCQADNRTVHRSGGQSYWGRWCAHSALCSCAKLLARFISMYTYKWNIKSPAIVLYNI